MSIRWLLLFCFILAGPARAATILVFGDSISAGYGLAQGQGWVSLLARDLAPRHAVVNASQSGETTAGGVSRLPEALARVRPDIVVLELGGNDGLRGLPLADMSANLAHMIRLARAARARVLLVGMDLPPNYGPAYTRAFQDVYAHLARKEKLAFLPHPFEGFGQDLEAFQADGIHPSARMQPLIRDRIRARLPL